EIDHADRRSSNVDVKSLVGDRNQVEQVLRCAKIDLSSGWHRRSRLNISTYRTLSGRRWQTRADLGDGLFAQLYSDWSRRLNISTYRSGTTCRRRQTRADLGNGLFAQRRQCFSEALQDCAGDACKFACRRQRGGYWFSFEGRQQIPGRFSRRELFAPS